jgi:hypothetical protein
MFKLPGRGRETNLLLEILMIVIGINVALWFEGWFQDLQDADIAERYIADLRDDLLTNIKNLDFVIEREDQEEHPSARPATHGHRPATEEFSPGTR